MPIPKTLSASSLQVAALCMDRWNAEYMTYARGHSNSAADVGTTCHGGLEMYVEAVYINKTHEPSFDLLVTYYQMAYVQTFGTADMDTDEYNDGYDLIKKWYTRTDLSDREVISVETKKRLPIPFNHPDGPTHKCEKCVDLIAAKPAGAYAPGTCFVLFTYIIDRLDKTGDTTFEVVDYKSVRVPIQPEDLENKLQARAYALAIQIEYPDATEIRVTFDLLRHERVSMLFKREDNIKFWNFLTSETQRIVDIDPKDIKPTLNPECGYCVKKATCPMIQKNIAVGGIHSLSSDEWPDMKFRLDAQIKAAKLLSDELADMMYEYAATNDELNWTTADDSYQVDISAGRSRSFDAYQAAQIMGPELFAQMGKMTLGNLEKLIKDTSLDEDMRKQLKDLIYYENGNLRLNIKKKGGL